MMSNFTPEMRHLPSNNVKLLSPFVGKCRLENEYNVNPECIRPPRSNLNLVQFRPNHLDTTPNFVIMIVFEFLDKYSLGRFRLGSIAYNVAVASFSLQNDVIPLCRGPFKVHYDTLPGGYVLTAETKWRYHNVVCDVCVESSPDVICYTCNLVFHSSCLPRDDQPDLSRDKYQCAACRVDPATPVLGFSFAFVPAHRSGIFCTVAGRHSSNYERNLGLYEYDAVLRQWCWLPCAGQLPTITESVGLDSGCLSRDRSGEVNSFWSFPCVDVGSGCCSSVSAGTTTTVWAPNFLNVSVLRIDSRRWERLATTTATTATTANISTALASVGVTVPQSKSDFAMCFCPSVSGLVVHGGWRAQYSNNRRVGGKHLQELHCLDTGE